MTRNANSPQKWDVRLHEALTAATKSTIHSCGRPLTTSNELPLFRIVL
jgi:hypothetical protein